MTRTRRLATAGAALGVVLALGACSDDEDVATSAPGAPLVPAAQSATPTAVAVDEAHNGADVEFAQGMIPHHRGAIEMVQLALDRAESDEVEDLAQRILDAQEPEIEVMSGWLAQWGEPVEAAGSAGHGGMSMGAMPEGEMAALGAAEGTAFDRLFLEMMTEHHSTAVEMAQTEQAEGQYADAIALAGQIESSQTAEIAEMGTLLSEL